MPLPSFRIAAVATLVALSAASAVAHPHVFIEARSEMVFKDGRITAIRHVWRFDEPFTAFAIQGLDADGDGTLTHEELQPLAKINVESLKEYDYFTFLSVAGSEATFTDPPEYWLDFAGGRLTLFYTLPLTTPLEVQGETVLEVYDPSYFIAFTMTREQPFVLSDAPAGCKLTASFATPPDAATAAELAQIPADVREIPEEFMTVTETLSNAAQVTCP